MQYSFYLWSCSPKALSWGEDIPDYKIPIPMKADWINEWLKKNNIYFKI